MRLPVATLAASSLLLTAACTTGGAAVEDSSSSGAAETVNVADGCATSHETAETAITIAALTDANSVERHDVKFAVAGGHAVEFHLRYEDTWTPHLQLDPVSIAVRVDTPVPMRVEVSHLCDHSPEQLASCIFGRLDWPGACADQGQTPMTMIKDFHCGGLDDSGNVVIRVIENADQGDACTPAVLRVRNQMDKLNDPSVDQDADH